MNNSLNPCSNEKLFDPIELSKRTENAVIKGNSRKYLRFGTTPD
ncbi:MAG: hypothetical protein ACOCUL_05260 [Bacteroidota bacterium]